MRSEDARSSRRSRRAFLQNGTLLLAAAATADPRTLLAATPDVALRVGMVTDLHYADKPPSGTRHYRDTLAKLADAATHLREQRLTMLVELGDLIDAADSPSAELAYLERINREFSALCESRHYVLGNHCVQTLTKEEFLGGVQQERSHYSFDAGGFHFVVLDACFRGDGQPYGRNNFDWTDANIPEHQLRWLRTDLRETSKPAVVFVHQRLDVHDHYGVKNASAVRRVLEESGSVLAVFQGHNHKNDLSEIGGIHYCTLAAMVEGAGTSNNAFSIMSLANDGSIRIDGFGKQRDYHWQK